jgi:hypothetical protein
LTIILKIKALTFYSNRFYLLNCENIIMPVLPTSYYSNYFLVSIGLGTGLDINTALLNSYTIPDRTFLASKFSIRIDNNASNKQMIQGGPGNKVKDSNALVYTYEIEFPIILNQSGVVNDYVLLHEFFMNVINSQYQSLWNSTITNYNSAFIESYRMNFNEAESTFQVVIISDTKLNIEAKLYSSGVTNSTFGRLMRNYDVYTQLYVIDVVNGGNYSLGPENNVFVERATFEIKFEYDTRFFLNSTALDNYSAQQSPVFFLIKNYNVSQKISIVGVDDNLIPASFSPGYFNVYDFDSTIYFGNTGLKWLHFNLYGYLKAETLTLSKDLLVVTDFDFSLYGATTFNSGNINTIISTTI